MIDYIYLYPDIYTITGNNKKECLTTLVMANAAGDLAPPMIVYSYESPSKCCQPNTQTVGGRRKIGNWLNDRGDISLLTYIYLQLTLWISKFKERERENRQWFHHYTKCKRLVILYLTLLYVISYN